MSRNKKISELIIKYLDENPGLPSLTLAKMIANAEGLNVEYARGIIRYYRGAKGVAMREKIRTTHGRHTYAPGMVRDAVNQFKELYPDWKPREDVTIKPESENEISGFKLESDYLNDLFK